ncbi:LytTR family DNA-binding domain-containing protein [Sphingomonas sp.]|uniref:LytTR family DNA-binding domain-containing protein n=1 Tax=Sphingomonas sp. TaxID=28214 RepID=UPI00286DE582|nr:LytTR family DNA-binding domain-containing protein [Sphingomonas sp.]
MLEVLRRPLSSSQLAALVAGVGTAVALYCLAYTALAGRPESLLGALAWAAANICPWLLAIEAGKRSPDWRGAGIALAAAGAASLLLGYALGSSNAGLLFEALRRLPALAASTAAVALLRSRVGAGAETGQEIPLLPRQIDWVRAAGNYIELRAGQRTIVHRGSIGAAERDLALHGFVRIHRSTLVRRDTIARVRPQDVVLRDGTHLKVGKRYRAALAG